MDRSQIISMESPHIFTAVGFRFRKDESGKALTPECLRGDDFINLVPEPTNKYDKNAIKIVMGGKHVAYVARDDCVNVAAFLKPGIMHRIELVETYGASASLALHAMILE